ncbi:hypothetical protein ACOMHN_035128 [Nucella lapillus]
MGSALKRTLTSQTMMTQWWQVLLLVTSSLACQNIQVPKKTGGNHSRMAESASGDIRHWPNENIMTYDIGTLGDNGEEEEQSSVFPLPSSPPLSLGSKNRDEAHTTTEDDPSDPTHHDLLSASAPILQPSRQTGHKPLGYDLSSMFASSSPADLLDDAEINELIHAEGMWSSDREAEQNFQTRPTPAYNDGVVSRQVYRRFSGVIVYVAFPLIIVGFVTNVIALKVFRRLPQNITNMYMTCLICFDMAYLLFVVSSHIVVVILRAAWIDSSARRFLQLYVVYKFFILSARQVIIMATAFMSLDRYLVIASPFRTHNIFLFRRPRLLILLTALLILAFNSHKPLKREVKEGRYPGTNHTVYYLSYSQLYMNNHGLLDDLTIASSCLFQYCPLFAMLVSNIALMTSLHKYSQRVSLPDVTMDTFVTAVHSESPDTRRRNDHEDFNSSEGAALSGKDSASKVTKMDNQFFQLERHLCVTVVAYSLLFFLLSLPLALLPILKKVFPEFNVFKSEHYLFLIYVRMFPLLHIISASINFFVFFIKGGAFKAGVRRLLRCRRYAQRKGTFRLRSVESEGIVDSTTERSH